MTLFEANGIIIITKQNVSYFFCFFFLQWCWSPLVGVFLNNYKNISEIILQFCVLTGARSQILRKLYSIRPKILLSKQHSFEVF